MKIVALTLTEMFLFCLTGCGRNPLTSPGILSFYSSKINASSAIERALNRTYWFESYVSSAKLFIKKIEISKTGDQWETVAGPTEINISYYNTVRIGNAANVPEGQYEGIRIEVDPKIIFTLVNSTATVTFEKLPDTMNYIGGNFIPVSNLVTFTSANGYLTPFKIDRGTETFLVFDLIPYPVIDGNIVSSWILAFSARVTRFIE